MTGWFLTRININTDDNGSMVITPLDSIKTIMKTGIMENANGDDDDNDDHDDDDEQEEEEGDESGAGDGSIFFSLLLLLLRVADARRRLQGGWGVGGRRCRTVRARCNAATGGCHFTMKRQVRLPMMESPSSHCGAPWKLMLIAAPPLSAQRSWLPHHRGATCTRMSVHAH